jgi:hypothetical protein
MARVKGCGTCFKPLAECECLPEDDEPDDPQGDGEEAA